MQEIFGPKIVVGPKDFRGDTSSFINPEFPPRHASWSEEVLRPWLEEPVERYVSQERRRVEILEIDLSRNPSEVVETLHVQLISILGASDVRRSPQIEWSIIDQSKNQVYIAYDQHDYRRMTRPVSEMVRLIFDGMRRKPYSDENIAASIATYISLACFEAWETMHQFWGDLIGIEMDGAGVRARGFCGAEALTQALRPDFSEYLTPKELDAFRDGGAREALGMLIEPSRMFVFDHFKNLFAEQVIPSIALERIEGDVLHFDAAHLRVFGLS